VSTPSRAQTNAIPAQRSLRAFLISSGSPILTAALIFFVSFQADVADGKRKSVPAVQPELQIVAVGLSPQPYTGTGSLTFTVEVELPDDLDDETILEVSSLINSPSMSSMRFLAVRHPVEFEPSAASPTASSRRPAKPQMTVALSWDGMDQSKQPVASGQYHYEIRAKLLAVGENGPRTHMSAWPKRGTLTVQ
jgi:hypothetical protein